VKQSDLGEYLGNAREKQNGTNIQDRTQTTPQIKANHKLPLKPSEIKSSAKLNKTRRLPHK
jgi:hypothetical protein